MPKSGQGTIEKKEGLEESGFVDRPKESGRRGLERPEKVRESVKEK